MTLTLSQSFTAVAPGITSSFTALGGTAPYAYSVLSGGAGGTVNSTTGVYTAPASVSSANPTGLIDTVQVTDAASGSATATILVASPMLLVCDIIQTSMALANGRVYLWDQKIAEPNDSSLYVAVSVPMCKPFANTTEFVGGSGSLNAVQVLNMQARVDIDIISRGPDARDRKEEVLLALTSVYSLQQQTANGFSIAGLSESFLNLSEVDGAAIPYRYRISVNVQYAFTKTVPSQYFDTFSAVSVATN